MMTTEQMLEHKTGHQKAMESYAQQVRDTRDAGEYDRDYLDQLKVAEAYHRGAYNALNQATR